MTPGALIIAAIWIAVGLSKDQDLRKFGTIATIAYALCWSLS